MSNLPKYYFGDIPAEVMAEIVEEMQAFEPDGEEIDHWLNCHYVKATIPDWYERVSEFKVDR